MQIPEDYLEKNKACWNKRTSVHIGSDFYNVKGFLEGTTSLNDTELELLGDIKGKSILHLQCHFGQDSLSLARMGAKVTGADLSDDAIAKARELNEQLQLDATFVCCDLYSLPQHLQGQFDIVFTSYGTIGWLPDLQRWGQVVRHFLKPGGRFVMVDFHPVVWMFNSDFTGIAYNYFNTEAIIEQSQGTYTDREAPIAYEEIGWNHSLEELFSGLLKNGLRISDFREYDYSHYNCFAHMEQIADRKYHIAPMGNKLPLMYAIVAEG
ncbi:class I SAM-dependent methyltransferase [Taibaiella chishuiensis]|uniref:Methyltransferase family protein n=1 Tax=Taibaiella chishuiensis TaxID=1434707 RepID=A0A2P8D496_9BACT|nr:class I SAM-dependent methyltransferase [Taibaiella chishuiensis]PSK92043.1 methyltransferase family protein [Taibaiella chishuiensis]